MILHFSAVDHGSFTSYEADLLGQKLVMAKALTEGKKLPAKFNLDTNKVTEPLRIVAIARTGSNGKHYANLYLTTKPADTFAEIAPYCHQ